MAIGVDLYQRYNTVVDWRALAGAVSFAWIKVSDGGTPANVRPDAYVSGCLANGIPWGGYHYAQPGDPVGQARLFAAELRRLGFAVDRRHLKPALDLESDAIPPAQRTGFARAFLETMRAELGCGQALYSSASWLAGLRPDTWPYDWDITWAAEYGPNDGNRHPIRHYGGRVDVHQYTSVGSVPGVAGTCDLNWAPNLTRLLALEDDMYGDEQNVRDWATAYRVRDLVRGHGTVQDGPIAGERLDLTLHLYEMQHRLRNLLALEDAGHLDGADPGTLIAGGAELPIVALLKRMAADLAELRTRPFADLDEAALAAELAARGRDPGTAAELKDIVLAALARTGPG